MTWNSTLKPGKQIQRKVQMPRARKAKREKGAGYNVAATLNFLRPHGAKPITVLRSEAHKANVRALGCVCCGVRGPSDVAHVNFGKSMGMKQCDSLTFPLCRPCHQNHDQGGMLRDERRRLEWHYVDTTRATLLRFNSWSVSVERHYQAAIEPLKRVAEQ